jgi:hypothetical protein
VGTNIGRVWHVQGWCIMALVNISLVEEQRGLKVGIGKDCNNYFLRVFNLGRLWYLIVQMHPNNIVIYYL